MTTRGIRGVRTVSGKTELWGQRVERSVIIALSWLMLVTGDSAAQSVNRTGATAARGASDGVLVAAFTEAPPRIDGDLNEPCWAQAPAVTDFQNYGQQIPARLKTILKILYTRDQVFVGVRCFQDVMGDVQSGLAKPGKPDQYTSRYSIEFFLKPRDDTTTFYQFAANINDMRFDCQHAANRQNIAWQSGFVVESTLLDDSWVMEFSIPTGTMGVEDVRAGDHWGLGLCRNNETYYATWGGMTTRSTLLDPAGYGLLLFGDLSRWWAQRVRGELVADMKRLSRDPRLTDATSRYWLDTLRDGMAGLDLDAPMTEARFPAAFGKVVALERVAATLKSRLKWQQMREGE
jgi:hypothetical protein